MKSRTAILFFHIVIVCASFLTSITVLPGPDSFGIVLSFYSLILLPGLLIGRLLRFGGDHPLDGICRSFALGIVYASLLVCLHAVPGASMRVVSEAGTIAILVLLFVEYFVSARSERARRDDDWASAPRWGSGGAERAGTIVILAMLLLICFVLFTGSAEFGIQTDAPDHLSFIRRIVDGGGIFPRDSFYREGDGVGPDPRKGIWHPVLALMASQADAPVEELWARLPSLIAFFALASFALFAREMLGSLSLAVPACFVMLVLFRGQGIGWFTKIAYGAHIAQVLFWSCIAFLIAYYREGDARRLVLASLISLAGAAVHLVFILLLGAAMISLLVYTHLSAAGRRWRAKFWVSVAGVVIGSLLPLALRWDASTAPFNLLHVHRQGLLLLGGSFAIADPALIASRLGVAYLFGLALAPFLYRTAPPRSPNGLVATLFLVPALIVFVPLSGARLIELLGYLHYRILYSSSLACLLVVGLGDLFRIGFGRRRWFERAGARSPDRDAPAALRRIDGAARANRSRHITRMSDAAASLPGRALAIAVIAVFVFFPFRLHMRSFLGEVRGILAGTPSGDRGHRRLAELLARDVPYHAVIVSDPRTSYAVSAYTDHFVAVTLGQHCSPADTAALERVQMVRDLFSPAVPLSASIGWLERIRAEYVLIDTKLPERSDFFESVDPRGLALTIQKFRSCPRILKEIARAEGFVLYSFTAPSPHATGAHRCSTTFARPRFCVSRANAPFDFGALRLAEIRLPRKTYAPGDTIAGSLCWGVGESIPFGLPPEWTIRLDTDFPRGEFFRSWFSKLYRRRIERSEGVFYRLTRTHRLESGFTQPDQWEEGSIVRQDFTLALPREMAPGNYRVKIALRTASYLPNRTVRDYFTNEDSLDGTVVASVRIER